MDFEQKILSRLLDIDCEAVLERLAKERCCQTLKEIRAVLDDDTLTDPECFQRIERIVTLYEALGPGAGSRHDFG